MSYIDITSGSTFEQQYLDLLQHVLLKGTQTDNRTGTPSYSVFGNFAISAPVSEVAFPILTTKKIAWKSLVTELLWFLHGYTTVEYLNHHDCRIWNEWATTDQCAKRCVPVGDLGPIYGEQWRHWGGYDASRPVKPVRDYTNNAAPYDGLRSTEWMGTETLRRVRQLWTENTDKLCFRWSSSYHVFAHEITLMPGFPKWFRRPDLFELRSFHKEKDRAGIMAPNTVAFFPIGTGETLPSLPIDQIATLIAEVKANPDSRRLIVNSWNSDAIPTQALTPCHNMFQVSVRPYEDAKGGPRVMDLQMYQRSADIFLGVPFNYSSYALLLLMLARVTGCKPGKLTISFGDLHIYENHVAAAVTQLRRKPKAQPRIELPNFFEPDAGLPWFHDHRPYQFELAGYDPYPAIAAKVAV